VKTPDPRTLLGNAPYGPYEAHHDRATGTYEVRSGDRVLARGLDHAGCAALFAAAPELARALREAQQQVDRLKAEIERLEEQDRQITFHQATELPVSLGLAVPDTGHGRKSY
jgi:hypothetical protein